MKQLLLVFVFLAIILRSESARILAVLVLPSRSHQRIFHTLTTELVDRGHQLVVITPNPMFQKGEAPKNLTEIGAINKLDKVWTKMPVPAGISGETDRKFAAKSAIEKLSNLFYECLGTEDVRKIIEDSNIKFDLLILEGWFRPSIAFFYKFNVPVIRFNSFNSVFSEYKDIGVVSHPILYPGAFSTKLTGYSFSETIKELYDSYFFTNLYKNQDKDNDIRLKQYFGPGIPSLSELNENVNILMVNMHSIWEMNVPTPPSVVHVSGIHLKAKKELPKDFKSYLDDLPNDVIYISFGSISETAWISAEQLQMMVNVLSRLPYQVIWKWNEDGLPGRSGNIMISKWLPQEALLKHPKVKLFITQGGFQSTQEAIVAGVPLLGMPHRVDQFVNVENYIRLKIGRRLDMKMLTEERFEDSINTLIKDKSYRQNILQLSLLLHDERLPPLARAVWWTEHVLRHAGAPYLRAPAANMHWARYYQLDLIVLLAAVALLACFAVYKGAKILLRLVWRICVK
ncbi:UDP-glycosyltransferase UGT5-like [Galleria mellonella]|uniref:UDP-glucuronosyltransferase n=1 Tax=Galleria mellonella TaxID=7137 RepID=A0A6J3CAI5_GALME|nr:UDP-glycosyltransferase UGT5-like [Galleria mellonella]